MFLLYRLFEALRVACSGIDLAGDIRQRGYVREHNITKQKPNSEQEKVNKPGAAQVGAISKAQK